VCVYVCCLFVLLRTSATMAKKRVHWSSILVKYSSSPRSIKKLIQSAQNRLPLRKTGSTACAT